MPVTQFLPRSSDPALYRDQVRDIVLKRWFAGREAYHGYFNRVPRWYEAYRGFYTGKVQVFRNNIHVPVLFYTIQTDVSRKVQTLFSSFPYVQMMGYGPEDAASARKNELLISAQMEDANTFVKALDYLLSADLYGTAVLQHGWREQIDEKVRYRRQGEVAGLRGQFFEEKDVVRFSGPDWEVRDVLDCSPDPGAKRIKDMQYFTVRYWMDFDDVVREAKRGVFNRAQVEELRRMGPTRGSEEEYYDRKGMAPRTLYDDTKDRLDRFTKPVQIYEMWGTLPDELLPADGVRERVITVADRRVVLRNDPNPFWHGEKPFIEYSPMPDPHYFFGPSKVEVSEKLQYTASRLASQKLDVYDLVIDPVFLYDKQRFSNRQELYVRSGRPIGVDGPPSEVISALTPNLQGLQMSYAEIDQLQLMVEQATGVIRDVVAGMGVSKRQTAREVTMRREGAMTRLGMEARIAEEQFIEPLANAFRKLNRQYLSVPKEVRILGRNALQNPITGAPLEPEEASVGIEDLNQDYDVRAVGASQALSKEVAQQNIVTLLQLFSANPFLLQQLNWQAVGRTLFQMFEVKNPEELMNPMAPTQPQAMTGGLTGAPGGDIQSPLDVLGLGGQG